MIDDIPLVPWIAIVVIVAIYFLWNNRKNL